MLGSTSCRPGYDDLRIGIQAGGGSVVVADQKSQLIQPSRRKEMKKADIDFMFLHLGVGPRFGQDRAAHVLILEGLPFVGVSYPELIAVYQGMKHAPGGEEMAGGSGNIFRDQTILIFRPDKGLAIISSSGRWRRN